MAAPSPTELLETFVELIKKEKTALLSKNNPSVLRMRKMKVLQEKDGVTSYKGIAFYFYPMLKFRQRFTQNQSQATLSDKL